MPGYSGQCLNFCIISFSCCTTQIPHNILGVFFICLHAKRYTYVNIMHYLNWMCTSYGAVSAWYSTISYMQCHHQFSLLCRNCSITLLFRCKYFLVFKIFFYVNYVMEQFCIICHYFPHAMPEALMNIMQKLLHYIVFQLLICFCRKIVFDVSSNEALFTGVLSFGWDLQGNKVGYFF